MRVTVEQEQRMMEAKKTEIIDLNFDSMVACLRRATLGFPDPRSGKNSRFSLTDAALSAFSIFFTQSPSFLYFQESMQKNKGASNAQSLFNIGQIPCDNQIRFLLDESPPSLVFPVYTIIIDSLVEQGFIEPFRSFNGNLLAAFDGTQYFSSKAIHCENCNKKEHENGTTTYFHSAVTPAFVAPGNNKVIPLPPEFITPQDGNDKQDCENAAAKRWLNQWAPRYKELGITVLGDDLYCKQPIVSLILEHGLDFILVCKPKSHKTLYQWIDEMQAMDAVETLTKKRWTGSTRQIDHYRFVNHLPLRDGEDAQHVNWCEITTTLPDGTVIYKNAFATNFEITKNNVEQIVADGRARWKIENENNNVLKNRGYHLEHNYGHGKKHLSSLMAALNILAFLFHTVLDVVDEKYKLVRENLPTRQTFFDDIRALTRYIYFKNWEEMLDFMIEGLEIEPPDTS